MPTGFAYDEQGGQLLLGYTFNLRGEHNTDAGRIEFAVIDVDTFEITYTDIVVDSTTATRAHFLLNDDVLFVIYDDAKSGSPDIYGMTIDILTPMLAGDVNTNNIVNHDDIDLLRDAVLAGTTDPIFNVDGVGDDPPDGADFEYLIVEIFGTNYGDSDLNKQVNFTDFVSLTNNFGSSGTGWGQGNFNLDDITNFADFVFLANNYGNDLSRGVLVQETVPEPVSLVLLSLAVSFVVARRRGGDGQ